MPPDSPSCRTTSAISSIDVGHALRDHASVLACPGVSFGVEEHLRLNFGFGVDYVRKALDAMAPVLQGLAR